MSGVTMTDKYFELMHRSSDFELRKKLVELTHFPFSKVDVFCKMNTYFNKN